LRDFESIVVFLCVAAAGALVLATIAGAFAFIGAFAFVHIIYNVLKME
jgi:hypothetical protein